MTLLAHYETASGFTSQNRSWYRALNAYKMAVICLIGACWSTPATATTRSSSSPPTAHRCSPRSASTELGIDEQLDDGPVMPREERLQQLQAQ